MLNMTCCISFISALSAVISFFSILFLMVFATPTRFLAFSFSESRSWNAVDICA
jgi:hypothetical protein